MFNEPLAFFLTFTTYGTWLHGDERGSITKKAGRPRLIEPSGELRSYKKGIMRHGPVILNQDQRRIVLSTVIRHCELKQWRLHAGHVRNNHVHLIISSPEKPEKIITQLKAWATRKLRQAGYELPRVWSKHGSTKYIFSLDKLNEKIQYVIKGQGEMMEYYQQQ